MTNLCSASSPCLFSSVQSKGTDLSMERQTKTKFLSRTILMEQLIRKLHSKSEEGNRPIVLKYNDTHDNTEQDTFPAKDGSTNQQELTASESESGSATSVFKNIDEVSVNDVEGGKASKGVFEHADDTSKDVFEQAADISEDVFGLADDVLTHVDSKGKANMVDVGEKLETRRVAVAVGTILLGEKAFKLVINNKMSKGDVLTVSEIAGIMGAKKTSELIPLCHPLSINKVHVRIRMDETNYSAVVECTVSCTGKTGVEMEALTGVSVTLLTLYDMCKAVSKSMILSEIKLLQKTGGRSDYSRHN